MFQSLYFINYFYNNYNSLFNIDDFSIILNDFLNIYVNTSSNFYYDYNKSKNKDNFIKDFLGDKQTILQEFDKYFYYYFILKISKQIESKFDSLHNLSLFLVLIY